MTVHERAPWAIWWFLSASNRMWGSQSLWARTTTGSHYPGSWVRLGFTPSIPPCRIVEGCPRGLCQCLAFRPRPLVRGSLPLPLGPPGRDHRVVLQARLDLPAASQPHRQRDGQDQVVMGAFPPDPVGLMARRAHPDLEAQQFGP